jgi:hypothetical protein
MWVLDPANSPALLGLGRSGISNWVQVGAATTWQRLADDQRQRIRSLLEASSLSEDQKRVVGFCAGLQRPASPGTRPVGSDDQSGPESPRERFGLFRRR